jgi:hypothetical protein
MENNYNGAKFDQGKARHDLVLPEFEDAIAQVLTFGAEKYAAHSWKTVPDLRSRYYSALRRHLNAWRAGEDVDPESGLKHLAHAACNIYFLLQWELEVDKAVGNQVMPCINQLKP